MSIKPVIVVQGGAGAYILVLQDDIKKQEIETGVVAAARAGYGILLDGGTAVDAVEASCFSMENNPIFNCGRGSYYTADLTIEMDASIMDGRTLRAGGVTCITNVSNPIQVARLVMDKTPHLLLAGDAATRFAGTSGFEHVSTDSLVTPKAITRLKTGGFNSALGKSRVASGHQTNRHPDDHDTVGAVALDCHGNVAYATTTGGISGKMCGRVGDSPLVGSGGYADNCCGAVSTTGDGEAFMKMCAAKHVAMLMEAGKSPEEACAEIMSLTVKKTGGYGGCVAVNPQGDIGVQFNTEGMAWATIKDSSVQYGMYAGETNTISYVMD